MDFFTFLSFFLSFFFFFFYVSRIIREKQINEWINEWITKTIQVRRTRHSGHYSRSRDELITDTLLWTPSRGWAKAERPARTYIQQLCRVNNYEYIYPSPPDEQVSTQAQFFLKSSLTCLNLEFSFSLISCHIVLKEPSLL